MGLINFWSCSVEFPLFPGIWLVEQFPCICKQTADWIELKKKKRDDNTSQAYPGVINSWSHSSEFLTFPGLWFVNQFLCIYRQTTDQIELRLGWSTQYGSLPASPSLIKVWSCTADSQLWILPHSWNPQQDTCIHTLCVKFQIYHMQYSNFKSSWM